MRLTIHQPEHLPWLGFFSKVLAADAVVLLDTVPFRKNYFQNRNRMLGRDGREFWATVPVRLDGHTTGEIRDVQIAPVSGWQRRYLGRIGAEYLRHPRFDEIFPPLRQLVDSAEGPIADLNERIIRWIGREIGGLPPMTRASALVARGARSQLLVEICSEMGATTYLSGPQGAAYLDVDEFRHRGIAVEFFEFRHPEYPQLGQARFCSHLSAVDLLMNEVSDPGLVLRAGGRCIPSS